MTVENLWRTRHEPVRAALDEVGLALEAAAPGAAEDLQLAVTMLRHRAREEQAVCGAALRAALPELWFPLVAERDLLLTQLADAAGLAEHHRVRAYGSIVALYRTHLERKEADLWPAVRRAVSEPQIESWQLAFTTALVHPRVRQYRRWAIGAYGEAQLARMLRNVNDNTNPRMLATFSSVLQDAIGAPRYECVVRRAGLTHHLDVPYTSTGAELIGEEEERNLGDVLRRRRLWRHEVASDESYVARFEHEAEALFDARHVHATVSGTIALQIALLALGVGPGDEVVIPAVTWVGCADAVILCGAVPVPARIDETLSIDPADAERCITPRTRAVMGVSLFGNPCNIVALRAIADRHGVSLVEDDCQAAGVRYRGRRLGSYGDVGVFSTNFMKFIAAGDGGFITTDRDDIYAFAVLYTGGKTFPARKRHLGLRAPVIPFTTLRMNELTGAVALAQLRRLDLLLERLRRARDEIRERVGVCRSFRWITGNDPDGAAGSSILLIFDSERACQTFAAAVRAQGVRHVTTAREHFAGGEIHHCFPVMANEQFIPGSGAHFAADFPAMVTRTSIDLRHNPWTHPRYEGNVHYPDGFTDDSLALTRRIAMIQTNPRLESTHCAIIADAVRRADQQTARTMPAAAPAAVNPAT